MSEIRVRFAPSPTGFLHVGGARTAIFNYLFAKHHGGKFILRVEDTDTERNRPEYEKEILESMKWLGLGWDEGPFYQSQRFDHYRTFVQKLVDTDHAYRCYCTPEEIDAGRKKAEAEKRKPMYDRKCRDRKDQPQGVPFCIRFKAPLEGKVVIEDLIRGDVTFDLKEIDDFIILRTNNTPIYNLTVVVDDVEMKVTHVVRGEEHLNNAPKQVLLMQAVGFTPPKFAHLPLILAPDRTKLSKRKHAVAVTQFKEQGFLPEAMFNYLVRLGWSHGDQEFFTLEELCKIFELKDIHHAGAIFDVAKMSWMNAQYIQKKSLEDIVAWVREVYGTDLSPLMKTPSSVKLLTALRERATLMRDFVTQTQWYLRDDFEKDAQSVETIVKVANVAAITALKQNLLALSDGDFVAEKIAAVFKDTAKNLGLKMPDVAKPARVLLTGTLASPDIGLVVEALGRDRATARLQLS